MLFPELLKMRRVAAGLSQRELAQLAGLSEPTISNLERGKYSPRGHTTRVLADALRLTDPVREEFMAAAVAKDIPRMTGRDRVAVTRSLPNDIVSFTGRNHELLKLQAAAEGIGGTRDVLRTCVVTGMAGTGKSALALHAAHELAERFPDGQFMVRLNGHVHDQDPVDSADALGALLAADGVPPPYIPDGLESRAGLWRARTTDRRMLLLLDDALGSDQIRPLLPSSAQALVLVTSRDKPSAFADALWITIDVLEPADAALMFVRLADRPGLLSSDEAIANVVSLCGYLPLAIALAAGNLKCHPAWEPADSAADLAAAEDRLALLAAENESVAAAFGLSYRNLAEDAQQLFRRLGLHIGAEFDLYSAVALNGGSTHTTRQGLDDLLRCHLISELARGRYRFHDLVREYARLLAAADPPAEQDTATRRLLDYYLHVAGAADHYLAHRTPAGVPEAITTPPTDTPVFTSHNHAARWMDTEFTNLQSAVTYAAMRGLHAHVVALPAAMNGYLHSRSAWSEALKLHSTALKAARLTGEPDVIAGVLTDLGHARYMTGAMKSAASILTEAVALLGLTDDDLGHANALHYLGIVHGVTEFTSAVTCINSALEMYRTAGDKLGEAYASYHLGVMYYLKGDAYLSETRLTVALKMFNDLDNSVGMAGALCYLGVLLSQRENHSGAEDSIVRALQFYRNIGDRHEEAGALYFLGAVQMAADDLRSASESLARAAALYEEVNDRFGQAGVLNQIGQLYGKLGHHIRAMDALRNALELYLEFESRNGEAEVRNSLGELMLATGSVAEAKGFYQRGLAIATSIGARPERARALEGIGRCDLEAGRRSMAAASLRRSMEEYQQTGSCRATRVHEFLLDQGLSLDPDG